MKIKELLTESENLDEISRPDTMGKAMTALEKAGYEHLGSGIYGSVYRKHGADKVIKVFATRDSAYAKFVELAQTNPNPHFPKFKGNLIKVTKDYYAVQIENLSPMPKTPSNYGSGILSSSTIGYALNDYTRMLHGLGPTWIPANKIDTIMDDLEQHQPGIKQACKLISDLPFIPDIHEKNIMLRGKTIVITDPLMDF